MKTNTYVRYGSAIALLFLSVLGAASTTVAQVPASFEAALTKTVNGEAVRTGTALATIEGNQLRVIATFSGLAAPWAQADVYSGDPDDGGEAIANLAIFLPTPDAVSGGFDNTVTLTDEQVENLQQDMLYVIITTFASEPEDLRVKGRIVLQTPSETTPMETPLSQVFGGYPVARGSVRAFAGATTLRVVGFFNGLASNWTTINISRGAFGEERTPVASIFNLFGGGVYAGFDHTFEMGTGGWKSDFESGLYHIDVAASRVGDGLQGQMLPYGNSAPEQTIVLAPSENETIVIGGNVGETPVDPEVLLGTVALQEVSDPDEQPVGYWVQFSDRPGFSGPYETITYNLGVGTSAMPLSVSQAAQIFDRFFSNSGIPVGVPKTIFVRGITTDGSRYAVGEPIEVTFIRGSITSVEPGTDVPAGFVLHGNYPNPFNPGTKIQFDLNSPSDVTVTVFDMSGRQVIVVPVGLLPSGSKQTVDLDGSSLTSGTYLYRVVAQSAGGTAAGTGQMTLLK